MRFSLRTFLVVVVVASFSLFFYKSILARHESTIFSSGRPLDIAILDEDCFFMVTDESGEQYYTRFGRFCINEFNKISHEPSGYTLSPAISAPSDSESIYILPHGEVEVTTAGKEYRLTTGAMALAKFLDRHSLRRVEGTDLLKQTNPLQGPITVQLDKQDAVLVLQGWIERSGRTLSRSQLIFVSVAFLFALLAALNPRATGGNPPI